METQPNNNANRLANAYGRRVLNFCAPTNVVTRNVRSTKRPLDSSTYAQWKKTSAIIKTSC